MGKKLIRKNISRLVITIEQKSKYWNNRLKKW